MTTVRRLVAVVLCFALAAGLAAGCGRRTETTERETGPIVIGNIQDLSAGASVWGQGLTNGATLAIEKVNAEGGVLGRELKLVSMDMRGVGTEAISAYHRLVDIERVSAIIGPPFSDIALALAPVTEQKRVAVYGYFMDERCTTPSPGRVWNFMFLGQPSCGEAARIIASYAMQDLGLKKFGVLFNRANAWSVAWIGPLVDYVIRNGGQVVATETCQWEDTDYKTQLTKILRAEPEALVFPNYLREIVVQTQQARELGFKGPIIGPNAFFVPFAEMAGKAADNIYFANNIDYGEPHLQDFIKEYRERFKIDPVAHAFMGWDAVMVIADAINRAGSTDPVAIAEALATTEGVPGLMDTITISPHTHRPVGMSLAILKIENQNYIYIGRKRAPD